MAACLRHTHDQTLYENWKESPEQNTISQALQARMVNSTRKSNKKPGSETMHTDTQVKAYAKNATAGLLVGSSCGVCISEEIVKIAQLPRTPEGLRILTTQLATSHSLGDAGRGKADSGTV